MSAWNNPGVRSVVDKMTLRIDPLDSALHQVPGPHCAGAISSAASLVLLMALTAGFGAVHAADGPVGEALSLESTARKPPRQMSDRWITTKVKAELLAVDVNEGARVQVQTARGVVTLTGSVASREAVEQIRRAAERPFGVKSVESSGLTVDLHPSPNVSP